jgi:hypothetical protein
MLLLVAQGRQVRSDSALLLRGKFSARVRYSSSRSKLDLLTLISPILLARQTLEYLAGSVDDESDGSTAAAARKSSLSRDH